MNADLLAKSEPVMNFMDFYLKSFEIEMSAKHVPLIPSVLWSLMVLGKLD